MIPILGCDPQINVLFIGAEIIKILLKKPYTIEEVISEITKMFDISIDHVILSLDWLYTINAIYEINNKLIVNEIK